MILWGLYAGLYLQKPIVWARLRPGVPFFGASHPFRRPFSRSISGGSHRPAHKNSRAFSSFLCTALAFFPRSCYTTHEVASFKPMLQVCICALLPMQPYTPHGDSNSLPVLRCGRFRRCSLIPLTGTVTHFGIQKNATGFDATFFLLRFADFCGAPTRCLQNPERCASRGSLFLPLAAVAAAAPHGDSNSITCAAFITEFIGCNLIPLTGTVT